MLMKLTTVINFINILRAAFALIYLHQRITKLSVEKSCANTKYEKVESKMLMKLTLGETKVLRQNNAIQFVY